MNDTTPLSPDRLPGRHPVNVGHLVMGVAFVGLLTVWALIVSDVVEGSDIRFLMPAPWVLAGLAGLVALITSDRRRYAVRATGWVASEEEPSARPDDQSDTMEPR